MCRATFWLHVIGTALRVSHLFHTAAVLPVLAMFLLCHLDVY